ncbi:hypothetical protein EPUL_003892 [Erysiphe pulchra]|uniref:DUF4219 domain-containing protein n=1 Tax=Erysiphe pulchra TaxID=225359 RepID=A0A2S4PU68_9PEZI|nr:hypothetical protein EPUL_003892 [Erysiphe pulchra]
MEITTIPRDVLSLFNGFDKLDGENWNLWKGHMQDNLEMCELWDIVTGIEKEPNNLSFEHIKAWKRRELIARVVIKNSLGVKDYRQIRHAKTAAKIWHTLAALHQPTGAQGRVDLVWQFWNKRCEEDASVHEHIGEKLHMELAELGIIIEDHMLAILTSKSLSPSYDTYVSTIFAGIRDLKHADPY